jgi:hypothetical protein
MLARAYKEINAPLFTVFGPEVKMNTVHVWDVARAAWHVADWYTATGGVQEHGVKTYNLADLGDTSTYS